MRALTHVLVASAMWQKCAGNQQKGLLTFQNIYFKKKHRRSDAINSWNYCLRL